MNWIDFFTEGFKIGYNSVPNWLKIIFTSIIIIVFMYICFTYDKKSITTLKGAK